MGNYNPKKSTPCLVECMRALKWIPVLFIGAVIIWSYYAYVVQLCLFSIENIFEKIVFLIFYHLICILFFWSYWSTVFTPIGTIPSKWRIPESEVDVLFRAENQEQQKRILEHCARDLPITNRTVNGSVRFCEKCKIIKPDRAHHCSVCGTCVLKMDHHCPWVNNCVNFKNYKCFVLFLGYGLLYCLYVALTTIEYFVRFWRAQNSQGDLNDGMGRFNILFLFFVSLMFAISLVSLFGYHVYLVLMNRTTLEAFRAPIFRVGGPDKNGFNLGKYANFQEVFGDNWKLWLLPVFSSMGDGIVYTVQPQHQSSTYNSMGDTQTHRLDAQPTDKLITLNETSLHNPHPRHEHHLASNPLSTRIQIENHVESNKKPEDLITAATISVAEQKRQKQQQQPGAAGATSSPTKATSASVADSAVSSSNSSAVTMNHDGNVIIDMNNTDQQQDAAAAAIPSNPKT